MKNKIFTVIRFARGKDKKFDKIQIVAEEMASDMNQSEFKEDAQKILDWMNAVLPSGTFSAFLKLIKNKYP